MSKHETRSTGTLNLHVAQSGCSWKKAWVATELTAKNFKHDKHVMET